MALDIRLQQKLQQKLVMTPQLRQAIKILQLQREELETLIDEELAENPVLERAEGEEPLTTGPQTETEIATVDSPTPTPQDDINWQAYLDNYSNDMPALPATGSDDDDDDRLNVRLRYTSKRLPELSGVPSESAVMLAVTDASVTKSA